MPLAAYLVGLLLLREHVWARYGLILIGCWYLSTNMIIIMLTFVMVSNTKMISTIMIIIMDKIMIIEIIIVMIIKTIIDIISSALGERGAISGRHFLAAISTFPSL